MESTNVKIENITQLNDDVLLDILSWLSIFDAISLFQSCKRMENVAEIFCKKFTKFDFTAIGKMLSLEELNQLLKYVGKRLTKLNTSEIPIQFKDGNELVRSLHKTCSKLEELNLSTSKLFTILKTPLPTGLKSLSFSYELESDQMADHCLKGSHSTLKTLRMFDMMWLHGDFLDKFKNLQHLQLECCIRLKQKLLINCLKKHPMLRKLEISGSTQISDTVINHVCSMLPLLTHLRLEVFTKKCQIDCCPLEKLLNLSVLHLTACNASSAPKSIVSLISAISNSKRLNELFIDGSAHTEAKLPLSTIAKLIGVTCLQKLEFYFCSFVDKELLMTISQKLPLTEMKCTLCPRVNDDALLAFAVKATQLERLCIVLCPVTDQGKDSIIATIQPNVDSGKRRPLHVDFHRAYEANG